MNVSLKDVLTQLSELGNEKVCRQAYRKEADGNQYGVRSGDLRKVAKKIKKNQALALKLWDTGNVDARLLACLIVKPNELSQDDVDRMARSLITKHTAEWFNAYVVKDHPNREELRLQWIESDNPMAARAGWNLMSGRVVKSPDGLDLTAILNRLEAEMPDADPLVQWTMNYTLSNIGIEFPEHRERALDIGERLGVYRDLRVSKGCTSPFAPIWIRTMVERQG